MLEHWRGAERQRARARAAAAPGGRVTFVGPLDSPGVAAELRGAHMVVVPSLIREAFPLITLEGLASGAPPVCADHGGLSAVLDELAPALGELGDDLRVSMDGDVVANLADRVVRVLRRLQAPAGRAQAIQSCRALAERRYGWARVAADLEVQYRLAGDAEHEGGGRAAPAMSVSRPRVPAYVTPIGAGDSRP